MSKAILSKKLGEIFRNLRNQQGLPLRVVAGKLDMDVAILSKLERGERPITKEVVLKLAKLYRQSPETMMITFLSEKILTDIGDDPLASQALLAAEQEVAYRLSTPSKINKEKERDALMKKASSYFKKQPKVTKAWLFGSWARGEPGPQSDVDIAIEVDPHQSFTLFDLAEIQEDVMKLLKKEVDVIMINGLREGIRKRVNTEKKLIYEIE